MTTREEFINGLRQLADFLTVNPQVPTPPYPAPITVHCNRGDDWENYAAVERAAAAMGVEPGCEDGSRHFRAVLHFGPVAFQVLAIPRDEMADHVAVQELGRAALEASRRVAAPCEPFVQASPAEVAEAYESSARYAAEAREGVAS